VHFWTPEGKRFIDFNSQLMCVNVGHGDERVVRATRNKPPSCHDANPFMARKPRSAWRELLVLPIRGCA